MIFRLQNCILYLFFLTPPPPLFLTNAFYTFCSETHLGLYVWTWSPVLFYAAIRVNLLLISNYCISSYQCKFKLRHTIICFNFYSLYFPFKFTMNGVDDFQAKPQTGVSISRYAFFLDSANSHAFQLDHRMLLWQLCLFH